jgi:hypothetical protein
MGRQNGFQAELIKTVGAEVHTVVVIKRYRLGYNVHSV